MTDEAKTPIAESDIAALPLRRTADVVCELIPLSGRRVVDVGCGDGGLVRMLAKQGAQAMGIEARDVALARARSAPPVADEIYALGRGEDLPLQSASVDAVVYLNSLHHVPVEAQAPAVAEARRVLRPGGHLLVIEPLAAGPYFELMRPIEDETEVRAAAYAAIRRGVDFALEPAGEYRYRMQQRFAAYEAFADRVLQVDDSRQDRLAADATRLRASFAELARRETGPDGVSYVFDQPMRANLLRAIESQAKN